MTVLCNVALFLVIYGLPFVVVLPIVIKVIIPILNHFFRKIQDRARRHNEWYNSLSPEEKIAYQLKRIGDNQDREFWRHFGE